MSYFKLSEFDCKCGCGKNNIDPRLVEMLNLVREHCGEPPGMPLVVNSGCRCHKHNEEVGGSPTSSHLTGHAVDIRALSDTTRFKIVVSALMHGFSRIGIGRTFVHLDNDPLKVKKVFWLY